MTIKAELRGLMTGALLAYGLALLLISVPRGLPGLELLQSLRFHLAALGVPLAFMLVFSGARWRGVAAIALMLASLGQGVLPLIEGYQKRAAVVGTELATMRVLHFNVLSGNPEGRAAADYIIETAPDVAVILESPGIAPYLADIARVLPYRLGCDAPTRCDLTMFSRTPLTNPRMLPMAPFRYERLAVAETVVNGVPITVVGLHLSKPYFDEVSGWELHQVRRALDTLSGRVLVTGDFNAAAWSDQLVDLTSRTALVPPPWHPATWPIRLGPLGVPIDNMFTRGALRIDGIVAPADNRGSNHRPLLAEVSLLAEPAQQ